MESAIDEKEDKRTEFQKKMRRGGRRITLKFPGICADCGTDLPMGSTARWYGRGRVYGLSCHAEEANH